jgi:ankyrin repeat protein
VQELVSAGADVNEQGGILLSADAERRTGYGTPLTAASSRGCAAVAAALIKAGADVNGKNGLGQTPLMYAAFQGDVATVRVLRAAGADLQAQDDRGRTAAQFAARAPAGEMRDAVRRALGAH